MKKIILISLFMNCGFLLTYGQSKNSTQLYASAIDTTLEILKIEPNNQPILVRAPGWYGKDLNAYRGNFVIKLIQGLKNKNIADKKEFILLQVYPLLVSNSQIIIMIEAETIVYKSKNKWTMKPIGDQFFYTAFDFDPDQNSFRISEVITGRFCPITTDWEGYNIAPSGL